MAMDRMTYLKTNIAYGLFNTPIKTPPLSMEELKLMREATLTFKALSPVTITINSFRNYVVHRFENKLSTKRALVVHGWSSRSTYMVRFIKVLLDLGYAVYAVDLPAHGNSKGLQISWNDSIKTVLDTQNIFGKFDVALGHSLGGTAILGALSLADYLPEFESHFDTKKIALISAPTKMQTIVDKFSNYLNLTTDQKNIFSKKIKDITKIDLELLDAKKLQMEKPSNIEFLCAHGTNDKIIPFKDSVHFSELENVHHVPVEGEGHIHILHNEAVLAEVSSFLKP